MTKGVSIICMVLAIILVALPVNAEMKSKSETASADQWTDSFDLDNCRFSDTGRNEYFILEPGYRLTLKGVEDNDSVTLVISVLNETQAIDGVSTRIVEERETANGELVEVSRNYFAFCSTYASVFYFGEDVDIYEDGTITGHQGSWRAGENGFRPGLMMPGLVTIGSSYYQEIAPDVAMDRARIVDTDMTLDTPGGRFEKCLMTEETSALEPESGEYKIYAPGVGLIKDGDLLLSTIEKNQDTEEK